MEIKMEQLLQKMSIEVDQAKQYSENSSHVRDQLIAIKTLCELALNHESTALASTFEPVPKRMPVKEMPQVMQQQVIQSAKPNFEGAKLASDGANGDSLFDF
ncbi:hypothetical protein FZC66_13930 [Priestia megaterium]|nr:hypothetical protein FZC66_13930 [Priestia megaterium]